MSTKQQVVAAVQEARTLALALPGDMPPDPPPPPPPDPNLGVVTTLPIMRRAVCAPGFFTSDDAYDRYQTVLVLSGPTSLMARTFDRSPWGAAVEVTLKCDALVLATATTGATGSKVNMPLGQSAWDALPHGHHFLRAEAVGFDSLEYPVYVDKGAPLPSSMPATTGSYTFTHTPVRQHKVMVPARFDPVTKPYPARAFPDHPAVPRRQDLIITSLAPARPSDLYRPARMQSGLVVTANRMNYFDYDFTQPKPFLPLKDGPRGRGSCISAVHLEIGNAAPNGVLRGHTYALEAHRLVRITADGTITTLAGYVHDDLPPYWREAQLSPTVLGARLVGDWSAIPSQRWGFAQPWGMAWDRRTLEINEQAPPIPSENNENPHVSVPERPGPTVFISDTYRDRVLKLVFSATAHGVPPKVTEFITGLNKPWSIVADGTTLYVSERMGGAIKVFDMDTGALLRTIPTTQPEGMALLDGWLYFGSIKTKSIRKLNLATGENLLVADPTVPGSMMSYYINDNSRYMHVAVSDGTFGPRGMIAYTTWSNIYGGYPILLSPEGRFIDWVNPSGVPFKGVNPAIGSYSAAVTIAHGRMTFSTAEDGLHVVSEALPSDEFVDQSKYSAGANEYKARGLHLTHGPGGWGYYGLPQPWGVTANIDVYLRGNGH